MCLRFYKFTLLRFSNYTGVTVSTTMASLLHFSVYFMDKICIWVFSMLSATKPDFKNLNNHSWIQFSNSEESIVLLTVVARSNHTNCGREDMDYDPTVNKESVIIKFEKFTQEGCRCRWGSTGGQCCNDLFLATGLENLYNCLELSHAELDLVLITNIQAFTLAEATPGEKRKKEPTL